MDKLKRARRLSQREFESLHKDMEELLAEEELRLDLIEVKEKLFTGAAEKLKGLYEKIIDQLITADGDQGEEDKEYDEMGAFMLKSETLLQQVQKVMGSRSQAGNNTISSDCTTVEARVRNFKLPPIQIKPFKGEMKDWLRFWAQFEKIHQDVTMSDSDKFWHLLNSLEPNSDAFEIVDGYPMSNENYAEAVGALKRRYGNKDLQLQVYIRELLDLVISNVNSKEKIPLKSLFTKLDSYLRALKSLDLESADPATWLFPLVESSLPEKVLYNWQRDPMSSQDVSQNDSQKTRLDLLMAFVEKEVEIQHRMEITKNFSKSQAQDNKEQRGNTVATKVHKGESRIFRARQVPTLSSFHVGDKRVCAICDKTNHEISNCFRAKSLSYDNKVKILKEKGLCFRCGGPHMGKDCRTSGLSCQLCRRKHLTVLCKEYGQKRDREQDLNGGSVPNKRAKGEEGESSQRLNSASNFVCSREVALQTLMIKIGNGNRHRVVRAFIDGGSQRSYIKTSTAEKLMLDPMGMERVIHSMFGGRSTEVVCHLNYDVELMSLDNMFKIKVNLRGLSTVCGKISRVSNKDRGLLREFKEKGVTLTDVGEGSPEIEVLIGADVYRDLIVPEVVEFKSGVLGIKTKLGWTLIGEWRSSVFVDNMATACLTMSVTDALVAQLWDIDVLGIKDPVENMKIEKSSEETLKAFESFITRNVDGRYSVRLPWKRDHPMLKSNREVALKRLENVTKKLKDCGMIESYDKILQAWCAEHFIEKVPENECEKWGHYLPHRGVIKVDSLTTPLRVVFDASCRGGGVSLNDCLEKGENLIKLIFDILLRFRMKRVAFVSDIRKAFQMVEVDPKERNALRFLWWKNEKCEEIVEYRHTRVVFGVTCSPFILAAVLHNHLNNLPFQDDDVGSKLLSSMYVDNCVSCEDTVDEYKRFRCKSTKIMSEAKMDLRMWMSNVEDFENENTLIISVLGMQWDRFRDELFVKCKSEAPVKVTKRTVLSTTHKLFDPLGIISPAVLPLKLMLQQAWTRKLKWDDEIGFEDVTKFRKWCEEMQALESVRVPRLATGAVTDKTKWSLHTFADASKSAYGAAVYLRVEQEGMVSVQLLAAKARVAPVKELTIPRLELMGCLIGVRLCETIITALQIRDVSRTFWSDSTTALWWIQNDNLWGTFVGNRTKEINLLTRKSEWRHVPGSLNPADLPSRGCSIAQLIESEWWNGPAWLYECESLWPEAEVIVDQEKVAVELRKTSVSLDDSMPTNILKRIKGDHSFAALTRIIGYVRRYLYNRSVKDISKRKSGRLSCQELIKAEIVLIREIQKEEFSGGHPALAGLEIFEDDWGVKRVKTRLTYSSEVDTFKYPAILPNKRCEVTRLIKDTHIYYCHAGIGFVCNKLRRRFWIIRARQTVRNVLGKCYRCRKARAKAMEPVPAPLPADRMRDVEVFEIVGVDLGGPLHLKNGKKAWFVIFTCAVFRAVHFELVGAISTRAFLNALDKFVRKFRRPSIIYSDNGTNFRGADNWFKSLDWDIIQKDEGVSRIQWKFNPVTAAWWGGWWERLIGTAKDMLRKTVGKGSLSWKELDVVLNRIAEAMNARPLTHLTEDLDDLEPLTPELFLHPLGNTRFPECEMMEADRLRVRYKHMRNLKVELRRRFREEYLAHLVNRDIKRPSRDLKIGELVLVGSDDKKRLNWPMGKIVELIPGRDGAVRLAKVRIESGECVRTIQRLYPLELDGKDRNQDLVRATGITRYGRRVKAPQRYQ